ncbi:MAG: hypothetical protein KAS59_00420, partial [Alphaproteobacteria bacterium]|nr:hypothetical protein [Alphaproteobacteria bacterium]
WEEIDWNRAEYLLERKKMMQDYADILDAMAKNSVEKVIVGKFKKNLFYCELNGEPFSMLSGTADTFVFSAQQRQTPS